MYNINLILDIKSISYLLFFFFVRTNLIDFLQENSKNVHLFVLARLSIALSLQLNNLVNAA